MSSLATIEKLIAVEKFYIFYSVGTILLIGIIGNILNILVISTQKSLRGNTTAFYLKTESMINIINLSFAGFMLISQNIDNNPTSYSLVWCKILSMIVQILTPTIATIICLTAIDQFLSTSHLFYIRQLSSHRSARRILIVVVFVWIFHSISFARFAIIDPYFNCFPSNLQFIYYYLFFYYPVLLGILPVSISSMFSFLAYRNVRRIVRHQIPIVRRRLDQQMTALVFLRVITYVILSLPYIIFYIYFFISFRTATYLQLAIHQLIGSIIYSLVYLNSGIVFYAFFISSVRYRRQIKHLFVKKIWRRLKHISHSQRNQVIPFREICD